MDSHPSCRRPHKFPAYTFKEPGSWPQRLPPCPDVSVEVSRSFWQLASVSSTPRDGVVSTRPGVPDRRLFRRASRTFWQLLRDPSTPRSEVFPSPLTRPPKLSW